MLEMAISSGKLFLAGKLFQDNKLVMKQFAIGAGAGAVTVIVVGQFAPIWVAAIVGGGLSGLLQPFLFKDLKYA